jgi:hypothetical protein
MQVRAVAGVAQHYSNGQDRQVFLRGSWSQGRAHIQGALRCVGVRARSLPLTFARRRRRTKGVWQRAPSGGRAVRRRHTLLADMPHAQPRVYAPCRAYRRVVTGPSARAVCGAHSVKAPTRTSPSLRKARSPLNKLPPPPRPPRPPTPPRPPPRPPPHGTLGSKQTAKEASGAALIQAHTRKRRYAKDSPPCIRSCAFASQGQQET